MPYTSGLRSAGFPRYGTVMNVFNAPVNIIKSYSLQAPPSQSTSDGYPNGTLTSTIASQGGAPDGYYDKLLMKWNGQATINAIGTCAIIYSSSNVTFAGISGGLVNNNLQLASSAGGSSRVVFKHGSLIAGVSGGNGSAVVIQMAGTASNISANGKVKISVGVSANLATGPNSDGSWTVASVAGANVTLANSSGVVSPTVTTTGGPDVQSEIVTPVPSVTWSFQSGNTFSGFNSLVFCKLINEALVDAGKQVDPDYVAQLKQLKPSWLRMMDISGVQLNWESDFAARTLTSYIDYPGPGGWYNSNYWVGAITNSGSDAFTCAAPSLTSTGAYKHGEIVQGNISVAETSGNPTLNVNARGVKPIVINGASFRVNLPSAAGAAGQAMQFTFTASWLNGGTPYVFTYTTTTTGHFGNDTSSASILAGNVSFALAADATLNGKVGVTNSGGIALYPLTPQNGALTIGYSGTPTCSITRVVPGSVSAGNCTFVYSYVLDAWLYKGGGLIQSVPLEYMIELCNSVGASMWYTWPINTKVAYVTAFTQYVKANLNSGLRFGTEVGNEMWNFGASPWAYSFAYGWSLGLELANKNQNGGSYGWTGLKTKQFAAASIAAWTGAGGSRSMHYIMAMSAEWDITNTNTFEWAGTSLTTSNITYATYGGPDGTAGSTNAASDYSSAPNRPIDTVNAVGFAPYWGSDFLGGDIGSTGTLTGTAVQNAHLLNAANKYKLGNTSGAYDDLYAEFYENVSLGGPAGGLNLLRTYKNSVSQQVETILRGYDVGRTPIAVLHYEAGPQFGLGNINNGTNDATTDIPSVTAQITSNSWDVTPYGFTNPTDCATQLCGMVFNFKFSQQYYNLYVNYMRDVITVHAGREACASQYGYSSGQWGLFPKSWTLGTSSAYSSYQAIADFNAGI